MFVAAVVLGGLAGTVATRSSREAWLRGIVIGIVTGIIVFVAYAVGINLLGVTPAATTGEALAFVLAALGAAAGPKILAPKPST
jgi:uncharacterized membrane protein YeaQ/YmgE (transglycosylase-associated protein family)